MTSIDADFADSHHKLTGEQLVPGGLRGTEAATRRSCRGGSATEPMNDCLGEPFWWS